MKHIPCVSQMISITENAVPHVYYVIEIMNLVILKVPHVSTVFHIAL